VKKHRGHSQSVGGAARIVVLSVLVSETKEVGFVDPASLARLNIHPSMRLRIDHYLERRPAPYIG
jgi:hypothetical protein